MFKIANVKNLKYEYYALETGLFVRCQNSKFEVLTGAEDSLKWKDAAAVIDSISRMIPKNAMLLNNEDDAKELYLKYISME